MDLRDNNSPKSGKSHLDVEYGIRHNWDYYSIQGRTKYAKHMVSAILATLAGAVFRLSAMEWLFLFLAIF